MAKRKARILILDDEAEIVSMLTQVLTKLGFAPISATDIQTALEICRTERLDLVLTDIRMPDGDGFEFARSVFEITRKIPIVAITGFASEEGALKAFHLGMTDYIAKPFLIEELLSAIARALAKPKKKVPDFTAFQQWFVPVETSENSSRADEQIQLGDFKPSEGDVRRLFELAVCNLSLARHDVENRITCVSSNLELSGMTVQEILALASKRKGEAILKQLCRELKEHLEESTKALFSAWRLFRKYMSEFEPKEHGKLFVARPSTIVRGIQAASTAQIFVPRSADPSLTILFPRNVLSAVLTELVENAVRHASRSCKILIKWGMNGGKFWCEVHDDGKGILPESARKFVPLEATLALTQKRDTSGLRILNQVIHFSKGLLLFSRSDLLGGALVRFEIPILGHHGKDTCVTKET